jgi:hypothetical protein
MLTKNINNNMSKKFLKLVENTITRYSNGGLLTGDQVELSSKFKSVPDYKNLSDDIKQQIEELFSSDDTIIVVNIQTKMPSTAPGNADNRGTEFVATVARMIDSGRYDNQGKISLPLNCLKKVDNGINRSGVPEDAEYDNKVQIDPEEAEENEQQQQTMTQQGDSLKKSNLSNARSNTKIPSKPATPSPAVNESYTSQYMPING